MWSVVAHSKYICQFSALNYYYYYYFFFCNLHDEASKSGIDEMKALSQITELHTSELLRCSYLCRLLRNL